MPPKQLPKRKANETSNSTRGSKSARQEQTTENDERQAGDEMHQGQPESHYVPLDKFADIKIDKMIARGLVIPQPPSSQVDNNVQPAQVDIPYVKQGQIENTGLSIQPHQLHQSDGPGVSAVASGSMVHSGAPPALIPGVTGHNSGESGGSGNSSGQLVDQLLTGMASGGRKASEEERCSGCNTVIGRRACRVCFSNVQLPAPVNESAGAPSNQKEEKDPVTTAENPHTTPIDVEEDAVSVGDADQYGERVRKIQHRLVPTSAKSQYEQKVISNSSESEGKEGEFDEMEKEKGPLPTPALWPHLENRPDAENPYTTSDVEEDGISVRDTLQDGEWKKGIQQPLFHSLLEKTNSPVKPNNLINQPQPSDLDAKPGPIKDTQLGPIKLGDTSNISGPNPGPTVVASTSAAVSDQETGPLRRSRRTKKVKFVGRRISHQWILGEGSEKTKWYSGTVLEVIKGVDGAADAEYKIHYDEDNGTYDVDDVYSDYWKGWIKFTDV